MNAIVSGRSGRALIIEEDSLSSFDLDDPSCVVPRQKADLPYLFGEAADLRILENTNLESVERELKNDRNFTWALELTLISLDSELPKDIRKEALEALDELFAYVTVIERVENVLYSAPLPEDSDLKRALALCKPKSAIVRNFLQRLAKHQPQIATVMEAWKAIPIDRFSDFDDQQHFQHVAVKAGLFRDLATLDPSLSVSSFLSIARSNPSIQQLPNFNEVLQAFEECLYDRYTRPTKRLPINTVSLDALLNDENDVSLMQLIDPGRNPGLNAEINERIDDYVRWIQLASADFNERETKLLTLFLEGWTSDEIASDFGEDVKVIRLDMNAVIAKVKHRIQRKKRPEDRGQPKKKPDTQRKFGS